MHHMLILAWAMVAEVEVVMVVLELELASAVQKAVLRAEVQLEATATEELAPAVPAMQAWARAVQGVLAMVGVAKVGVAVVAVAAVAAVAV